MKIKSFHMMLAFYVLTLFCFINTWRFAIELIKSPLTSDAFRIFVIVVQILFTAIVIAATWMTYQTVNKRRK